MLCLALFEFETNMASSTISIGRNFGIGVFIWAAGSELDLEIEDESGQNSTRSVSMSAKKSTMLE